MSYVCVCILHMYMYISYIYITSPPGQTCSTTGRRGNTSISRAAMKATAMVARWSSIRRRRMGNERFEPCWRNMRASLTCKPQPLSGHLCLRYCLRGGYAYVIGVVMPTVCRRAPTNNLGLVPVRHATSQPHEPHARATSQPHERVARTAHPKFSILNPAACRNSSRLSSRTMLV